MTDPARVQRLAKLGSRLGGWGIRIWTLAGLVAGFPWLLATSGIGEEPDWIHEVAGVWVIGLYLLAIATTGLNYWLPRLTVARDPRMDRASDVALSLAAVGSTSTVLLLVTLVRSEPPWLLALGLLATAVSLGGFLEGIVRLKRVPHRGR